MNTNNQELFAKLWAISKPLIAPQNAGQHASDGSELFYTHYLSDKGLILNTMALVGTKLTKEAIISLPIRGPQNCAADILDSQIYEELLSFAGSESKNIPKYIPIRPDPSLYRSAIIEIKPKHLYIWSPVARNEIIIGISEILHKRRARLGRKFPLPDS